MPQYIIDAYSWFLVCISQERDNAIDYEPET